ncbi:MAG: hypothetical protein ACQEW2_17760 [Bacillota bacterium]
MKSKDVSRKKTDYEQITFRYYEYQFILAGFKKLFSLPSEKGKTKIEKYNIMCYSRDFNSFYQMHLLIRPVLEEYILESDERLKLLHLALELNPTHSKE